VGWSSFLDYPIVETGTEIMAYDTPEDSFGARVVWIARIRCRVQVEVSTNKLIGRSATPAFPVQGIERFCNHGILVLRDVGPD
jgi:hypothetical protein